MSIFDGKDATENEDDGYDAEAVAKLNDQLRANLTGWNRNASVIFMGELAAHLRDLDFVERLHAQAVIANHISSATFDEGDDPYGERDFGSFDYEGEKVFWKIDYFDLDKRFGSENPADPEVTHRVLSIFYARDY